MNAQNNMNARKPNVWSGVLLLPIRVLVYHSKLIFHYTASAFGIPRYNIDEEYSFINPVFPFFNPWTQVPRNFYYGIIRHWLRSFLLSINNALPYFTIHLPYRHLNFGFLCHLLLQNVSKSPLLSSVCQLFYHSVDNSGITHAKNDYLCCIFAFFKWPIMFGPGKVVRNIAEQTNNPKLHAEYRCNPGRAVGFYLK